MRSAVDAILKFNRDFHAVSLQAKLERLSSSPFFFFRGTFHLFARDVVDGIFRKWPCVDAAGPIVGDLHTENFGTYRSTGGEIVYDINDFDDCTNGPYEYDVRRLTASLVLAALDNKHAIGDGALAAETCARAYLDNLVRFGKLETREEFAGLKQRRDTRDVLASAVEKSRTDMMKRVAVESSEGNFVLHNKENYIPVAEKTRHSIMEALPLYLKTCLAPENAEPQRYTFQDVAFRIAGCGSLGRRRYAVLLGKGKGPESFDTLRLIEWKGAYDSAMEYSKPHQSKDRARDLLRSTVAFQVLPKRYLGYTMFEGQPMQAREIGANDARFNAKEFTDLGRFANAARIFGEITARVHLISSLGKAGPRAIAHELAGSGQERWIQRMVAFAVAYTDRTLDDYAEFCSRRKEIAEQWK